MQIFKLAKTNCGWRNIQYPTTCRSYLKELQRRSKFKNFFNNLVIDLKNKKIPKSIEDSSDIVSYRTNGLVKYSGKYHNYCIKMSIEMTPEYIPISYSLDEGTASDSSILDKMLNERAKLPYRIYLDKGYEKYDRRRILRRRNCQVKIEMKKTNNNRKRAPRFSFSRENRKQRGEIEKFYAWLKSFMILRLNRQRVKSLFHGIFLIVLSYFAFRKLKL